MAKKKETETQQETGAAAKKEGWNGVKTYTFKNGRKAKMTAKQAEQWRKLGFLD